MGRSPSRFGEGVVTAERVALMPREHSLGRENSGANVGACLGEERGARTAGAE